MQHLFRGSRLLVFIMMLSVMTGCMLMLTGGIVPETTLAESATENQTKPILTFYANVKTSGAPYENYNNSEIRQELLDELNKSQYFKKITDQNYFKGNTDWLSGEADIELSVTVTTSVNKLGTSQAARHSGQTLGLIPFWGTDYYEVSAGVRNKMGLEKEYVINDSVTFVFWLPLVVLLPFQDYSGENKVLRNMYRNIIQQMYEDGFMGEI